MYKKKTYKQLVSLILGACVMSVITSCNEDRSKSEVVKSRPPVIKIDPIEEVETLNGRYQIVFSPLNSSVSGMITAKGSLHVIADKISVEIVAKESPAMTKHSQFIYSGSECPTELNDINNDGYIDPHEAAIVLGEILIPLDSDLNSQDQGANIFPVADALGAYSYYSEGYVSDLLSDLQAIDPDPKDELGKLKANEKLKLEGKVVVIEGIPEDQYLPGSIVTISNESDRATLPIACGKITRVLPSESQVAELKHE